MGIRSIIIDPRDNTRVHLHDNALEVVPLLYPSTERQRAEIYSDKLATSAGSNDMGVDGSTTAVKFYTESDTEDDIYITRMNLLLGYGASAPLYDFADSGDPLTNGITFGYTNSFGQDTAIATLKTMYDILLFSLSEKIIPTAWELRNLGAVNDYGILAAIDLVRAVPPYGIQLKGGTNQQIYMQINDDCTDADLFEVIAIGFKRLV